MAWWHTPLIRALGRQKQADPCEFKASLAYTVRYRIAKQNKKIKKTSNELKLLSNNAWNIKGWVVRQVWWIWTLDITRRHWPDHTYTLIMTSLPDSFFFTSFYFLESSSTKTTAYSQKESTAPKLLDMRELRRRFHDAFLLASFIHLRAVPHGGHCQVPLSAWHAPIILWIHPQ